MTQWKRGVCQPSVGALTAAWGVDRTEATADLPLSASGRHHSLVKVLFKHFLPLILYSSFETYTQKCMYT